MFERFTEQARRVVVLAQQSARELSHHYVGTEHLLLGLVRHDGCVAHRALDLFDVTAATVLGEVDKLMGHGSAAPVHQVPFTDAAKLALERAQWESRQLRRDHIGTEGLLLSLVRPEDNTAVRVLAGLGVDPAVLRTAVTQLIDGGAVDRDDGGPAGSAPSGQDDRPTDGPSGDGSSGVSSSVDSVAPLGASPPDGGGPGEGLSGAGGAEVSVSFQLARLTAVVEALRAEVARLAAIVEGNQHRG